MKFKGANPQKATLARRNALGRGLSALMSTTAVPVDVGAIKRPNSNVVSNAEVSSTETTRVEVQPFDSDGQTNFTQPTSTESAEPFKTHRSFAFSTGFSADEFADSGEGATAAQQEPPVGDTGLSYLLLDRVIPGSTQPRQHFSQEEISSLSSSIRESGLLQPLLVRRKGGETGPLARYEIVAGERRYRAAKLAGLERIPAIIKQLSDKEALQIGIVENVQRENLNPIEEARAYQRLIDEFGETQGNVAASVGKDRTSIANSLRLLKLSAPVLDLLSSGKISAGHGRALLMLSDQQAQIALAERIGREGLSVRTVEQMLSEPKQAAPAVENPKVRSITSARKRSGMDVSEVEERFRRALGTKVSLNLDPKGRGELTISFFSKEELESLLDRLGA